MAETTPIRIYLSPPHMSGAEQVFVEDAFRSNWIAPLGPHVDAFESELCAFTGAQACAALNTGTSALHLALIMSGVTKDDIVICPTLTFSASANPIVYQGAQPVFVDCASDTWNIDPKLCEAAIVDAIKQHKKPKAIIVVHLYGMPAKMDELIALSQQYDIPLIEDAAESLGATYHGKHTGTFGRFGILSFNGNKVITTSGGGALLCSDSDDAKHARFLATQARDQAPHYQHSSIGYNYRLSNICAAIGRGQMTVLADRVAARRNIFDRYSKAFADVAGITLTHEASGTTSSRWLTTILIDPEITGTTREHIRTLLLGHGIESRPIWKPMHMQPIFGSATSYLSGIAESIFKNGLCLPSGSALSISEQDEIVALILSTLR